MSARMSSQRPRSQSATRPAVADVRGQPGGHRDVGQRRPGAAEHDRGAVQVAPDAVGQHHLAVRPQVQQGTTAHGQGPQLRHPEVRVHPVDPDVVDGGAGEAVPEHADVTGRPADVGHHTLVAAAQQTGAANRVARPGGERRDREPARVVYVHHGAVVLADVDRAGEAEARDHRGHAVEHPVGHADEAGVEDRGVLPAQQSDVADLVGPADRHAGDALLQQPGGLLLQGRVHRREHRSQSHGPDTAERRCDPRSTGTSARRTAVRPGRRTRAHAAQM